MIELKTFDMEKNLMIRYIKKLTMPVYCGDMRSHNVR